MMRRPAIILLVLLSLERSSIALFLSSTLPEACRTFNASRYDPLSCWLQHLNMSLPDQSFTSNIASLALTDMACGNFVVGSVESMYTQERTGVVVLKASNVSALCHGTYASSGLGGQLSAAATGWHQAVNIEMQLTQENGRPVMLNMTQCNTSLAVEDVQFTGSLSAKILNLFRQSIASYVSEELQQQMCPGLQQLDSWWSLQLDKLNEWLNNYTDTSAGPMRRHTKAKVAVSRSMKPTDEFSPGFRTLEDSRGDIINLQTEASFLKRTMDWLSADVLNPHLHEGLIPHSLWTGNQTCPSCDGSFFDGWNGVIHSVAKDGVNVPLFPRWRNISVSVPNYCDLRLMFHNVTVLSGLDQWQHVDVAHIYGPTNVSTAVETRNLTAQAILSIYIHPTGAFHGDDLLETFSIQTCLDSLQGFFDMSLGLSKTVLSELHVIDVLDLIHAWFEGGPNNAREPLWSSVHHLDVRQILATLNISSVSVWPLNVSGTALEKDLDFLLNHVMTLVLSEYQPLVTSTLRGLVEGPARNFLNEFVHTHLINNTAVPTNSSVNLFNLTKELWSLNAVLGRDAFLEHVNTNIQCISDAFVNVVVANFPDLHFLNLRNFNLSNLGSLLALQLLSPQDHGKTLETVVNYGKNESPPVLSSEIEVQLCNLGVTSRVAIQLGASNLTLHSEDKLEYDSLELNQVNLAQVLQQGQCLLVPAFASFGSVRSEIGRLDATMIIDVSIPEESRNVSLKVSSVDYPQVHESIEKSLQWLSSSLRDFVAFSIGSAFDDATFVCEGSLPPSRSENDSDDDYDYESVLMVIGAALLFAQPALILLRRHSVFGDEEDEGVSDSEVCSQTERTATDTSKAIMYSTDISQFSQICVPLLILCTAALLLSSNTSVGASVGGVLTVNGSVFPMPPLFAFSLVNTAKDMLSAGIYPLFFLVVVFSGIWPYIKLMLLLFSWSFPTNLMSEGYRGFLLRKLDALGKFSLVDAYVLVLMTVAFRYHLDISDSQSANAPSSLDIYVTPSYGFFSFLAATGLTLVAGHLVTHFHRRLGSVPVEGPPLRILQHGFHIGQSRFVLSQSCRQLLFFTFLCTFLFLIFGMTRKSFGFDFGGLAGIALGEKSQASYSLFSLGTSIRESVEDRDSVGIWFLQIAFFFYAVAMPLCCLGILACLLTLPLTPTGHSFLLTAAEITNAWSAVEVFVLSIVAALLQISTFASFIVGEKCDILKVILLNEQGGPEVSECFTVDATVSLDSFFLIVGVLLNSALVSAILPLCHTAIDETVATLCSQGESAATTSTRTRTSSVSILARHKWTQWMLCEVDGLIGQEEDHLLQSPPDQPAGQSQLPDGVFEDEWNAPADRDPSWKAWKNDETTRTKVDEPVETDLGADS